jgi:Flagellar hook capping protein
VPRLFSTALLFVLIGATAGAFVLTEGLKLEPSPITKVSLEPKIFSPTCECDTDLTVLAFRLRKAGRVTLAIVDKDGNLVRTLVGPVERSKGRFSASWDGRNEDGAVVPDGVYRARVHLRHKTILMPNRIRVGATPPVVKVRHIGPRVVEPGARLKVRYLLNEPAHVYVFLNGRRVVLGRSMRLKWKVEWPVRGRPGKYRVTLAARDAAGNLSDATRAVTVVIPLRVAHAARAGRRRQEVRRALATDGRAYPLGARERGAFASRRRLVLRAPSKPGRYTLVIRQDKVPHRIPVRVKQ